ncbi:MAG: carboxypeptidase M32 [Pseudomonadota bacterium]
MSNPNAYQELADRHREIALLGSTQAVLGWDQETQMPSAAVENRAAQLGQLTRITHKMQTDPAIGDLLAGLTDSAKDDTQACNIHHWQKAWDRATRVPEDLAVALSEASSVAMAAWQQARADDTFDDFAPHLETLVSLKRREAEAIGWADSGEAWDALAEEFDPGMTAASVTAVFTPLRDALVALQAEIPKSKPSTARGLEGLPAVKQTDFLKGLMTRMGFSFESGVMATSTHPFCTSLGDGDVRMTMRHDEASLLTALGSSMHECGHALYEQGLPSAFSGQPRGSYNGLSIHESQSRLWENHVGRSRAFWHWYTAEIAREFGLDGLDADTLFADVNRSQAGLIRVEADQATYDLHIMVRFELERALLNGDLKPRDLPDAWNAHYRDYLGITPDNNANGCLQDIHWSMGAMGYFPTYTLGNLYAAQFFAAAKRALPDLEDQIGSGEFTPLLTWLREQIHLKGRLLSPGELCVDVTGEPLSAEPMLNHLRQLHGVA